MQGGVQGLEEGEGLGAEGEGGDGGVDGGGGDEGEEEQEAAEEGEPEEEGERVVEGEVGDCGAGGAAPRGGGGGLGVHGVEVSVVRLSWERIGRLDVGWELTSTLFRRESRDLADLGPELSTTRFRKKAGARNIHGAVQGLKVKSSFAMVYENSYCNAYQTCSHPQSTL